ncbi:hypothetical protein C8J57DRAFT_1300799 [Mycena rebaudengoi]|nr:hypothetical protein C8J57DRAFT_1300799 [Mycena rebaudengoi]
MSSPVINRLVSFITRPLMSLHTAATMVSLQIYLHAALSAIPTPSSLSLSAHSLPPPQIQTACLATGIQWADWIHLLSNGKDVELFVSASVLAVQIGDGPRTVLWAAPAFDACPTTPLLNAKSPALKPAGIAFAASLRATLASARARRVAIASPSDSDISDSESESDVSDSGSSYTSNSSTTSASSLDSDVLCAPIVDRAKVDVTRYMYHGGVTQVMSGGVMLGGAPRPTPKASAPRPIQTARMLASRPKTSRNSSAVTANTWRKTV